MKNNNVTKDYARGIRITNRRKELRMTQDELASQIDIGRQALSAIENGGDFKVSVLNKMTRVLNITADEIVKPDDFNEKNNLQMELIAAVDDCIKAGILCYTGTKVIRNKKPRHSAEVFISMGMTEQPVFRSHVPAEFGISEAAAGKHRHKQVYDPVLKSHI